MTNTYTLQNSLDPLLHRALSNVVAAANSIQIDYFIAGATARDIVLHGIFGYAPSRATRDIDTAIFIRSWDEFTHVRQALIEKGMRETAHAHRFLEPETGLPLDIIPFGDIADSNGSIQWPPDYAVTMSVIGFDEAYSAALWVADGDLQFKVASLAGIALLKLIAWDEKGQERNKDAADFYTILDRYQTIHQDRLWDEYVPSKQYDYDIPLCCSFLLGFDIKAMLSDSAKDVLLRIHAAKQDQFISVIARTNSGVDIAQLESQFRAFWHGLAI